MWSRLCNHCYTKNYPHHHTHTHTTDFRKHWKTLKFKRSAFTPISVGKTVLPPDIFSGPEWRAAGWCLSLAFSSSWRHQVLSVRALWRRGWHCSAFGKWCLRDNKRGPGLKYIKGSQEYILTARSDLLIQRHTSSHLPRGEGNLAQNIDEASQTGLPTACQR